MRRLLFAIMAAAALCSCERKPDQSVLIDFDYVRVSPYMVEFTNYSHGCDSYRWDFGDGSWSTDYDATYVYSSTGTYTVTLTGTCQGIKHSLQQRVQITKPNVYFAGYTLYAIPYENRYYKLVFKDDNLLPSSWDFKTVYTPLLDNTDIPYYKTWATPKLLVDLSSHSYYTVYVYRTTNASNEDNDVQCMKQQLKVSDILKYQPEYVLHSSTDGTIVGIQMAYDYD